MAISLKHKFQSSKGDSADTSLIRPSNWNDDHDITMMGPNLIGRATASNGAAQEIGLDVNSLEFSSGGLRVKDSFLEKYLRVNAAQTFTDAEKGQAIANIGGGVLAGFRNLIINPLLGINQRQKSGTVVLAAGVYGHDRFKAGAGGCTYTFSTSNGVTTFNISAGSLQQVIGAENIAGRQGEYVLSWSGTAQGRVNGGLYGATGVPKATLDGSANVTVEWSTGTLSLPQLEREFVTDFSTRAYPAELHLCQYYAFTLGGGDVLCNVSFPSSVYLGIGTLDYPRDMRAAPSFSFLAGTAASLVVTGGGGGDIALSDFYLLNVGRKKTQVAAGVAVALSQWGSTPLRISTSPILLFNAEI